MNTLSLMAMTTEVAGSWGPAFWMEGFNSAGGLAQLLIVLGGAAFAILLKIFVWDPVFNIPHFGSLKEILFVRACIFMVTVGSVAYFSVVALTFAQKIAFSGGVIVIGLILVLRPQVLFGTNKEQQAQES